MAGESLPERPWLRRSLLLLIAVAFLAGGWGFFRYLADRQVWAAIAQLDRTEPGWRLADLEAARAPVADADNAARQVVAAAERVPPAGTPAALLFEVVRTAPPPSPLPDTERLRSALGRCRAAVVEARKLADRSNGRFPFAWDRTRFPDPPPHLQTVQEVARLLFLDAALLAEDRDMAGALRSCRALLQAGRSVGDEPRLASQTCRIEVGGLAVTALERVLAQGEAADADLAAVQRQLADEERQPLLLVALRGERAAAHEVLLAVEDGDVLLSRAAGEPEPPEPWWERLMLGVRGNSIRWGHARLLEAATACVAIARRPIPEQAAEFPAAGRAIRRSRYRNHTLALLPMVDRVAESFHKHTTRLRMAGAAVAAERFRLAHGRWPTDWKELVPGRLETVPTDPLTGAALRLRHVDGGVVIGMPRPEGGESGERKSSLPEPECRLWDAAKRRQP